MHWWLLFSKQQWKYSQCHFPLGKKALGQELLPERTLYIGQVLRWRKYPRARVPVQWEVSLWGRSLCLRMEFTGEDNMFGTEAPPKPTSFLIATIVDVCVILAVSFQSITSSGWNLWLALEMKFGIRVIKIRCGLWYEQQIWKLPIVLLLGSYTAYIYMFCSRNCNIQG